MKMVRWFLSGVCLALAFRLVRKEAVTEDTEEMRDVIGAYDDLITAKERTVDRWRREARSDVVRNAGPK